MGQYTCTMSLTRSIGLLLGFVLIGCEAPEDHSAARGDQALSSWLDSQIPAWLQQLEIPGVAIALVEAREITLLAGYGYANTEKRVPMTDTHAVTGFDRDATLNTWVSVIGTRFSVLAYP